MEFRLPLLRCDKTPRNEYRKPITSAILGRLIHDGKILRLVGALASLTRVTVPAADVNRGCTKRTAAHVWSILQDVPLTCPCRASRTLWYTLTPARYAF